MLIFFLLLSPNICNRENETCHLVLSHHFKFRPTDQAYMLSSWPKRKPGQTSTGILLLCFSRNFFLVVNRFFFFVREFTEPIKLITWHNRVVNFDRKCLLLRKDKQGIIYVRIIIITVISVSLLYFTFWSIIFIKPKHVTFVPVRVKIFIPISIARFDNKREERKLQQYLLIQNFKSKGTTFQSWV